MSTETVSTWRTIIDERDEKLARRKIETFCKGMQVYADAGEVIESLALREILPKDEKWRNEIKGELGKRFRERVAHLAMNRWRLIHKRIAICDAINTAVSYLQDTLGVSERTARWMISIEFERQQTI